MASFLSAACFRFLLAVACASLFTASSVFAGASNAWLELYPRIEAQGLSGATELRAAEALLDQKSAQIYSSIARWLPRLDLALSQSRSQDFSFLQSGVLGTSSPVSFEPQALTLARFSLSVRAPLYRRSVQLGVATATAERRAAKARLVITEGETRWKLRQAFGQWLLTEYQLATLEKSLTVAERNLKEAKLRFELGQRTRVDVLRAESNLTSLQSRRLTATEQNTQAMRALTDLAGVPSADLEKRRPQRSEENEPTLASAIEQFSGEIAPVLEQLTPWLELPIEDRLEAASPYLEQFAADNDSSRNAAANLWTDFFPDLDLVGSVSKQGQDWSSTFSPENRSYSVAVTLTIPIFSWGSSISSWIEKSAAQRQAELKQSASVSQLRSGAETQRVRIRQLKVAIQSQTLATEQRDEIVRLTFKSYQLGKSTMTELLASEDERAEAKIQLARLRLDLDLQARQLALRLGVYAPETRGEKQ